MELRKGYEVEWISKLPRDEFGDADFERATIECREFARIETARSFAKKVLPKSVVGAVSIYPFHREPYEPGWPGLCKEIDRNRGEEISE